MFYQVSKLQSIQSYFDSYKSRTDCSINSRVIVGNKVARFSWLTVYKHR